MELEGDIFLPNGQLNELRRNALAKLAEAIQSRFIRDGITDRSEPVGEEQPLKNVLFEERGEDNPAVDKNRDESNYLPYLDCIVSTKAQAEVAAKTPQVRRIYVDFTGYGVSAVCDYAKELRQSGKEVRYCFPRICRKETLERFRASFEGVKQCFDGYLIRNYETLAFVKESDAQWQNRCVLDYTMYVMNREAKAFYREQFGNVDGILTAPVELSKSELHGLGVEDMTLVAYGRLPLMVSAHCVKKSMGLCRNKKGTECTETEPVMLTDRVGKKLPVTQNCLECYNLIYNPECLSLFDGTDTVEKLHPQAIRLDFTFETKEETERILRSATGVGAPVTGPGYTRGHLKRGVE